MDFGSGCDRNFSSLLEWPSKMFGYARGKVSRLLD